MQKLNKPIDSFNIGCAIDFETSGYQAWYACALGLTRIEYGKITNSYYTLLCPPSSEVYFTHIHGLTWSDLKDAPSFLEAWPVIFSYLKDVQFLIAHNAPFDRRVLKGCLEYAGLDPFEKPFLCTLKGAGKGLKLKSKKLDYICKELNIPLNHHNAASDSLACAKIYLHLRALGLSDKDMTLK